MGRVWRKLERKNAEEKLVDKKSLKRRRSFLKANFMKSMNKK